MDLPDTSYNGDRQPLLPPSPPMRQGVSTLPGPRPQRRSLVSPVQTRETADELVLPASPGTLHYEEAPPDVHRDAGSAAFPPQLAANVGHVFRRERGDVRGMYDDFPPKSNVGQVSRHERRDVRDMTDDVSSQMGLVSRNDRRDMQVHGQTDFERMMDSGRSDRILDDNARRSSSYIDRGYLSESRLSPPTVERHGVDWEQQPMDMYGRRKQLAHTSLGSINGHVVHEPVTNDGRVQLSTMQHATSAGAIN